MLPGISTHPLAKNNNKKVLSSNKCPLPSPITFFVRIRGKPVSIATNNRPFQLVCFVFPIQTTRCSPGNFPFCLFINYAYICMWMHMHKTTFERNSSLGYHHVVWNGKTKHTSLTGPLITLSVNCINGIKVRLITNWRTLRRNPRGNWVILIFRGQKPCTRII